MPFVPKRPPALKHLSDEAASIVLAKHFGDVVKAAKELGVDRKDLRRLTWHNPRILKASHERMELFRIGVRSKIIEAVWSRSAKRRRWGFDAIFDSYEFRDQVADYALLAPAPRQRAKAAQPDHGQVVLEREAAAELEREYAVEMDADRRREQEGDKMGDEIPRALRASRWRAVDPVSEAPAPAAPSPVEPVPALPELPVWPGPFPPPPLVAHQYRPWTPPRQEPRRRVARSG
jgi:hypothetical protein